MSISNLNGINLIINRTFEGKAAAGGLEGDLIAGYGQAINQKYLGIEGIVGLDRFKMKNTGILNAIAGGNPVAQVNVEPILKASDPFFALLFKPGQGIFSQKIKEIADALMHLRLMVEAAIDFSEEDIDWIADQKVVENIIAISEKLHTLLTEAKQGALLKEGITLAIVGRPNVGKSSLLNALTQNETAIVTPLPGTTRDLIKESIHIDGYPVHLVDTAGFREKAEPIEQEGIKRAQAQLGIVDRILWVVESSEEIFPELIPFESKVTQVVNKIDLSGIAPHQDGNVLYVSAKEKKGIDLLRAHIKACMGAQGEESGGFIARKRHLIALQESEDHLSKAKENLVEHRAFDCAAEELRLAQQCLGEIVGKVTTDDLLGKIFSQFCIGK